jgi:hypothetical protein
MPAQRKPRVLPFQPIPLTVGVVYEVGRNGRLQTEDIRHWDANQVKACRLCPTGMCDAEVVPGTCVAWCRKKVNGYVPKELAGGLRLVRDASGRVRAVDMAGNDFPER